MQTITTLQGWFKTDETPTQEQFWEVFDSFWHKHEKLPFSAIDGLYDFISRTQELENFIVKDIVTKQHLNESLKQYYNKVENIPTDNIKGIDKYAIAENVANGFKSVNERLDNEVQEIKDNLLGLNSNFAEGFKSNGDKIDKNSTAIQENSTKIEQLYANIMEWRVNNFERIIREILSEISKINKILSDAGFV